MKSKESTGIIDPPLPLHNIDRMVTRHPLSTNSTVTRSVFIEVIGFQQSLGDAGRCSTVQERSGLFSR